jgi:hypothetical protein
MARLSLPWSASHCVRRSGGERALYLVLVGLLSLGCIASFGGCEEAPLPPEPMRVRADAGPRPDADPCELRAELCDGEDDNCNGVADDGCEACESAERTRSNVGCEYWPVPLANTPALNPSVFDFRVVIANPNEVAAHVRITRGGATAWSGTVDASGLRDVALPWVDGQSFAFFPRESFVAAGAYRLVSDLPVIVSQFNPFEYENEGAFSYTNDASLLLPAHVLTGRYVTSTYAPLSIRASSGAAVSVPGYVAVVGVRPGTTTVRVTAGGAVAASSDGRIAGGARGATFSIALEQGEVAHVVAASPPNCAADRPGYRGVDGAMEPPFVCHEREYDLTGTTLEADQPVAVFGGHVCAFVPWDARACDHLEEQMPPIETLGRDYVGAPMGDGSLADTNLVRVVAGTDDTRVMTEGALGSGTLNAGEFIEFEATRPFRISATQGVLVAQYLRGQFAGGPDSAVRGDPAMTLLVPAEQFRSDYTFILPTSYRPDTNGQNYVLVTRPPGLEITVDGMPATAPFAPVATSEVAVLALAGGAHSIRASGEFGILAYGLGSRTSYATPAGLNLEPIEYACARTDESCLRDADCCSGYCRVPPGAGDLDPGFCSTELVCRTEGQSCESTEDCCTRGVPLRCIERICAQPLD